MSFQIHLDAIIQKIHESGFRIAARKETTITHDIAESFYDSVKDKDYYDSLVDYMTRWILCSH